MFVKKLLIRVALMAVVSSPSYGMDGSQPQDQEGRRSLLVTRKDGNEIPDEVLVNNIMHPIVSSSNWLNPEVQNLRLVNQQWYRCFNLQSTLKLVDTCFPQGKHAEDFFARFKNLTKVLLKWGLQKHCSLNIPPQIKEFALTTIGIPYDIANVNFNRLTQLKALDLHYDMTKPRSGDALMINLDKLTELTRLNVHGKDVQLQRNALKNLTNLEVLSYKANDVSPYVHTLTRLRELTFCSCQDDDISNLTALQVLRSIDCSMFCKSLLGGSLQALTQLKELAFRPLPGDTINQLTNLTSLDLYGKVIPDLSNLSSITNLKRLGLVDNERSFDLGKGHKLEELKVVGCYPHPVNLEDLTHLRKLELSHNMMMRNEDISHLTNLISLHLNTTMIADINPLTQLRTLYLGDTLRPPAEGYSNLLNLTLFMSELKSGQ